MEEWQCTHITKNLSTLIFQTNFNSAVKAKLQELNILSQADIDSVDAVEKLAGISEASRQYYRSLTGRINAYKVLTKALFEKHQTGAARILIDGVPKHVSDKPLTSLGIPINLDGLKDTKIDIHGKKLTLQEFLPTMDYENLQQIFQETVSELEIFDTFVTKQKTFVLAFNSVPPKPPYYVPRFLSNRIRIDESIFKADCPDVLVFKKSIARYKLTELARPHFTNTSTSQLNRITSRFIYLVDVEDWNELKNMAKVPIHLINYEADHDTFLLEDSSAPSDILRNFGCREERVYMSEEEFVQQQLSVDCTLSSVCICDSPGMDKTFLLANIARLMADNCAGRIIVFIQLTSFADNFVQDSTNQILEPETSIMNVMSYICPRPQNQALLLTLIKSEILRLEIFFDSFDEISTEKVEWTKQVFRSITTTFPKTKIYITSRPHMRKELENSVGVVAYDILPFNQKNQIDFLVQYWQKSKPDSDYPSLECYASSCLEAVNKSLTKNDKEISGIPLLCQLIAEVYSDSKAFHSNKRRKLSDVPFKVSGMYQKFIEKKFQLVAKDNEQEFDHIKMVHIWHALKLLSPTSNFLKDKKLETANDLWISPKILTVGILLKNSNEAPEFIHRTFAEYLVADCFFTKLMELQVNEEVNCESIPILKLLLNGQKTQAIYEVFNKYKFLHPVIVYFFNCTFVNNEIAEELKMAAAAFVSSISHEDFICILCACCEHNLFNIFCLLTQRLTKWDKSRILECFTHKNSYELLRVCIGTSTSQLLQKCIQLLAEVLKLDMERINTYVKDDTLLQTAVQYANYEAVEYLVNIISLTNQSLMKKCVQFNYGNDDIETIGDILRLLHNKDSTLINETSDILISSFIDLRLLKMLVKFGANITAADGFHGNCAMYATEYMSSTDYNELVQFLLTDCNAEYLFLKNKKWKNPMPAILRNATLLPETLELLLNIPGIDINIKNKNGENLLCSAAEGYKLENIQQLVDRGLDYNARGWRNRSLLHVAARYGGVEMVRYLLSLKLDPNSRDEDDWTPLHFAAYSNNRLSVIEVLVENGANVQAKNNQGQTALHTSGGNHKPDKKVIKYLIETGVGVNDLDNEGNTPLHLLMRDKEAMHCLIEIGADFHIKNKKGETVLHTHVQNSFPDKQAIKYLIGNGVGVNDRDNNGNTTLHLCWGKEAKDCLIEMGADIHAKNKKGQTPAQIFPWLWK